MFVENEMKTEKEANTLMYFYLNILKGFVLLLLPSYFMLAGMYIRINIYGKNVFVSFSDIYSLIIILKDSSVIVGS